MAPEIFLTQYYNLKVDVYSFAIVLHCMLSLARPFEKYNAHLHSLLVCTEGVRPHIPHEWPYELQELLRYGWAQNPHHRPTMKDVRRVLERLSKKVHDQVDETVAKLLHTHHDGLSQPLFGNDPRMIGVSGVGENFKNPSPPLLNRIHSFLFSNPVIKNNTTIVMTTTTAVGKWLRRMEDEAIRGNATMYPIRTEQNSSHSAEVAGTTTTSSSGIPSSTQHQRRRTKKREPANYRQHLRSHYRL